MTTEAEITTETKNDAAEAKATPGAESMLGWCILGCLTAGGVGIYKAFEMEHGSDVFFCLLASMIAFGVVFYIYLRKH